MPRSHHTPTLHSVSHFTTARSEGHVVAHMALHTTRATARVPEAGHDMMTRHMLQVLQKRARPPITNITNYGKLDNLESFRKLQLTDEDGNVALTMTGNGCRMAGNFGLEREYLHFQLADEDGKAVPLTAVELVSV